MKTTESELEAAQRVVDAIKLLPKNLFIQAEEYDYTSHKGSVRIMKRDSACPGRYVGIAEAKTRII